MATKKTIRILLFDYTDDEGNTVEGRAGQTVKLSKEDVERGEAIGAFTDSVDDSGDSLEGGPVWDGTPIGELGDADLINWIDEENPTVSDVVDAANGDPELARRLLDAEESASGGDSRKGIVDGLGAIIERGNQ